MDESFIIQNILLEKGINQQQLSDILGVKKQSISMISNGKRHISKNIKSKILEHFPDISFENKKQSYKQWLYDLRKSNGYSQEEFASKLGISQSLYAKLENGERNVTDKILQRIIMHDNKTKSNSVNVNFCPEFKLPNSIKPISNDYIQLDNRLFKVDDTYFNPNYCYICTCNSNSIYPFFNIGDRLLIDTSCNKFIDNNFFAFVYNNQSYIRKIELLPNKIKCISTYCDEDTFYIDESQRFYIIGLIHPKIRV